MNKFLTIIPYDNVYLSNAVLSILFKFAFGMLILAQLSWNLQIKKQLEDSSGWDINWPCQEYIQKLADRQSLMSKCATINSSPPRVCTNCIDEYIQFKNEEYRTQHLDGVFSVDNRSCATVIYDNYILSYAHELSYALTNKVWEASLCESCLIIKWDLAGGNTTIELDQKTKRFENLLNNWRSCVSNETDPTQAQICLRCSHQFDALFDYYWKIYTTPGIDFCHDVDGTMNDTMSLWHSVWGCPDDPRTKDKHQDIRVAVFSAIILAIVIILFYAGSYIQSERIQANLIQYSRIQEPHGQRSRLLSSSTIDTPYIANYVYATTPSSSLTAYG